MRSTHNNRIANENLERLAALSDGVIDIALMLLVLDLRVPVRESLQDEQPLWGSEAIEAEEALWDVLVRLWSSLFAYLISFLALGIFLVGRQTQQNHIMRSNCLFARLYFAFLFAVSLMSFATALLAAFIAYSLALVAYWLNMLVLGAVLCCRWQYSQRLGLAKEAMIAEKHSSHERRVFIAQALYAFGALLCLYVSTALFVLMQLN